jgi:hypothetical protein
LSRACRRRTRSGRCRRRTGPAESAKCIASITIAARPRRSRTARP